MVFANPSYLVETGWLQDHLGDPDLRVLECTVFLRRSEQGGKSVVVRESGRAAWAEGHIPGSAFADLITDLSDQSAKLPFMMPPAEQFAESMGRLGVGEGTRVVCYDRAGHAWAARVWWMLRAFGFDNAAVLNGGWKKWTLEGRPVSTKPPSYPPARFVAHPREQLIADKAEVLAAIADGGVCVVNALSAQQHRGEISAYGRPGHIPSSVNLPHEAALDPQTGAYLPAEPLRQMLAASGIDGAKRVITYCGGGIAASGDALLLTLLGAEDVAVYDGSLSEWAADPALPLEVG